MDFVPPQIYDRALESSMFEYDGGKMKMNMDLDLNGNSILSQPTTHWISGVYNFSMIFPVGKIIHHLLHRDIHQNMKVGFEFLRLKLLLPRR